MREDEIDGGSVAKALGQALAPQGDTVAEPREMMRGAVHCHFRAGAPGRIPQIIRFHGSTCERDETLAA